MPRRRRSPVLALVVTGAYVAVVAVAVGTAVVTGDQALLWRLTIMQEPEAAPAGADLLVAALTAVPWAWALWQGLRGPLEAAPRDEQEPRVLRARAALYAAAATTLLLHPIPGPWPWWADTLSGLSMWAVAVLIHPVLARPVLRPRLAGAELVRTLGAVGFGGITVVAVLGLSDAPGLDTLLLVIAAAALAWTVLVLRAQRGDGRWRPSPGRSPSQDDPADELAAVGRDRQAVRGPVTGPGRLVRHQHGHGDLRPALGDVPHPGRASLAGEQVQRLLARPRLVGHHVRGGVLGRVRLRAGHERHGEALGHRREAVAGPQFGGMDLLHTRLHGPDRRGDGRGRGRGRGGTARERPCQEGGRGQVTEGHDAGSWQAHITG
ncbi:hypothetical protein [Nonomuraea coxensis]|uniref:hypothetical protein n=1 Tax=Nonomuraea coxensis TaxID=404386 RepID=UPI0003A88AEA|nr:hypothetical protein [Nonomuraea coxensis]